MYKSTLTVLLAAILAVGAAAQPSAVPLAHHQRVERRAIGKALKYGLGAGTITYLASKALGEGENAKKYGAAAAAGAAIYGYSKGRKEDKAKKAEKKKAKEEKKKKDD
ncbi:hypothetical protein H4R35_005908 [Dimargaris xerosporica]|nr:hypothetical protein H4R35_005908 [Dimargaris xerosporica]